MMKSLRLLFASVPLVLAGCRPLPLPGVQPVPAAAVAAPAAQAVPRSVAIVLDATEPTIFEQAAALVEQAVQAAGPGDRLLLVRVGEALEPARDVVVANLPALPPLAKPGNIDEFAGTAKALQDVWGQVAGQQQRIKTVISTWRALPQCHGTDLWAALKYAAQCLPPGQDRHLVVLSDLHHQTAAVSTQAPPTDLLPLANVQARVMFIKDLHTAHAKEAALWQQYLVNSGATAVELYDQPASRDQVILAPSGAPRQPPPPW
ncbi:MAG: VWA domain-containing protein [Fimbriimonadaceae bacterium]|nr:VWA domain-containing protein [Fimbriimonadaceae bacterium]